jgi:HEAT repeat protein
MRCTFTIVLVGLCYVMPSSAQAQPKKSDTSQVLEVGGKTLEEWIKLIHSKDRSKAETAIRSILYFSPERAYQAVPDLLSELKRHTPSSPLDISIRVNLAISLGMILGNNTKGADPKHMTEAVTLLGRLLKDSQSIVRYRAAEALRNIGPDAKAAVTDLLPLLKDTGTWEVRQMAADAMGKIAYDGKHGPPVPVLNVLYHTLGDSSYQVRFAAIQALVYLGPPADPKMREGLMNALAPVAAKDPEPTVEIWANMALISLNDGINARWLNPIMKFLKHSDPYVRGQAIQAIGTLGGNKVKAAAPILIDIVEDKDAPLPLVGSSIWALGRIGVWASDAIPSLEKIAEDPKQFEPLKKAAREAIDLVQGKKLEKKSR